LSAASFTCQQQQRKERGLFQYWLIGFGALSPAQVAIMGSNSNPIHNNSVCFRKFITRQAALAIWGLSPIITHPERTLPLISFTAAFDFGPHFSAGTMNKKLSALRVQEKWLST